jgi:hypothetical protein
MGKADPRPDAQSTGGSGPSAAARPQASEPAAPPVAGPAPARVPRSSTPPLTTSRTTTLDDPLTTSLLAEIARRPSTVEMTPAQLAEARAMAPGAPDPERGAERGAERGEDRDPDDPA